jgi:hypothetical protein
MKTIASKNNSSKNKHKKKKLKIVIIKKFKIPTVLIPAII